MQNPSIIAADLDTGWSNFDPESPLPSSSPFYVERQGNPIGALAKALLRSHPQPPKYFFSGHRGSGKSTELNCLETDQAIQQKYFPVKFSVKKLCDVNNLSYVDILLAIGAQVFIQYTESGGRLPKKLLDELEGWKGQTVERLKAKGAVFATGTGFDLNAFFVSALAKVQTEHSTREVIRQELEPRLSELIEKMNLIMTSIQAKEKRQVLVIIDDLDKPSLEQARAIFHGAYTAITQPLCAIVYTVPVAIFFSKEFITIREQCFFLPNVRLHSKGHPEQRDRAGYETMRRFVFQRMEQNLIAPKALNAAIALSGGVFREMAFVMQLAASHTIERGKTGIELADVYKAESRIRSDFRRFLSGEDYRLLREVQATNEMHNVEKLADLFHTLAVLEYTNDENWCDIHPSLRKLLSKENEEK